MQKPRSILRDPPADPVYLAADVVASLIHPLPAGTAYFIGVVLLTMMTGRLVQCKGSLARAALPFVLHLKWGWHRVERAMERGKFSLDDLFDRADTWCVANLPVEPVQVGVHKREVVAVDSSTIARWRATTRTALLGKGYCTGPNLSGSPHSLFHLVALAVALAPALDEAQQDCVRHQKLQQIVTLPTLHRATIVIKRPKHHLHRDPL